MFGLFARTFHAGIDHLAFQLVRAGDVELATKLVSSSYGAFHIVSALSPAIMLGWVVLAIGAYLSGVFGVLRAIALSLMAALMIGVLKGTGPSSFTAIGGLCIAPIPQGIQVLREGPTPPARKILLWTLLMIALSAGCYFLGQAG